jgi:hypothetical protein
MNKLGHKPFLGSYEYMSGTHEMAFPSSVTEEDRIR